MYIPESQHMASEQDHSGDYSIHGFRRMGETSTSVTLECEGECGLVKGQRMCSDGDGHAIIVMEQNRA